jgi:hypothetical protein
MDISVFEQLKEEELISEEQLEALRQQDAAANVSVHWDLRILLYLGVLLVSSGLGLFLYNHIDSIGHAALVVATGLLSAVCFFYCFRIAAPFSREPVQSPNVWFDYVLLLGCLLLVTFIGYLQYQFQFFGEAWGLATFIPMVLLFGLAYYFDHKGVLTLAITTLGAWMGVAMSPQQWMHMHSWSNGDLPINGLLLAALLHLLCRVSAMTGVKAHFETAYRNFGMHVLFLSTLAAMFLFSHWYLAWFLALAAFTAYYVYYAQATGQLYYMVFTILYAYVGVSYIAIRALADLDGMTAAYMIVFYFIGSGIGLIKLLMHFNKKLKGNDSI